jgi:F-type H+-transporting ATPase subunit c
MPAAVGLAEQPPSAGPDDSAPPAPKTQPPGLSAARAAAIIGACIAAGLAVMAGGLAISRIGTKCIESMARQPEAAGAMFAPMIVSAAMAEGATLFAILVCFWAVRGL